MKKIISLSIAIIACSNLFGQYKNGNLDVSLFMELTKQSISEVSSLLDNKGFKIQYIKDNDYFKGYNEVRDLGWAYNLKYLEATDKWEILSKINYSFVKILVLDKKIASVLYGFKNREILELFKNRLDGYGYVKTEEDTNLQTKSINIHFVNSENDIITLRESTNNNDIPYLVEWTADF